LETFLVGVDHLMTGIYVVVFYREIRLVGKWGKFSELISPFLMARIAKHALDAMSLTVLGY